VTISTQIVGNMEGVREGMGRVRLVYSDWRVAVAEWEQLEWRGAGRKKVMDRETREKWEGIQKMSEGSKREEGKETRKGKESGRKKITKKERKRTKERKE